MNIYHSQLEELKEIVKSHLNKSDFQDLKDMDSEWESSSFRPKPNHHSCSDPFYVMITGFPGSGKSYVAAALAELDPEQVRVIQLDGFHIPLCRLQEMPSEKDLVYYRGCIESFDLEDLYNKFLQLKRTKQASFPEFDHRLGDPVPNANEINLLKDNIIKVIVLEGIYLNCMDNQYIAAIVEAMDYKVFVDAPVEQCLNRLKVRNRCIPGYTVEQIDKRVMDSDYKNIMKMKEHFKDVVYDSILNSIDTEK